MSSGFDVIVIGVGGMGAAVCYHLARSKQRVLGLEQFDIPNSFGSSHGITRMFRYAYYESPAYVPMVRRSIGLWRDLATAFGEPLVYVTGTLDAGTEGNVVFEGAIAASREHELVHEVLSGSEINKRFPGFNLPKHHVGLFQPDGGFLACERATLAHVVLAQAAGAELHARETVSAWEQLPSGGVRVQTDRGTYDAGRLVIAAGPWISDLVPQLKQFAEPERQVTAWVRPGKVCTRQISRNDPHG